MRISVVISTYNRPQFLRRVLEGYFHQTRPPDEIIVADDGSTEETAVAISELSSGSPVPLTHVWHPDEGFRAAAIRNRAAARSKGEYLLFTDDDCVPHAKFVEDHAAYAEPEYFIQGHRVLVGPELVERFSFHVVKPFRLLKYACSGMIKNGTNALRTPWPYIRRTRELRGIRSCNFSLFRKDLLRVNGFNEDFVGWGKEDSELVVRLYKAGLRRKDVKFRACCFHLHHDFFERGNLEGNIALLRKSMESDVVYCKNGVDKYRESR